MTNGNPPTDPAQGGQGQYGSGPYGSGPYSGAPQQGGGQQPYGQQPGGEQQPGQQPYGSPQPPQYGSQQGGSSPYGAPQDQSPYGAPQGASPYGAPQGGGQYGSPQGGAAPYGAPQGGATPYGAPQDGTPYGAPPQGGSPYGGGYGAAPMGAGSTTTVVPNGPQALGPDGEPALSQPLYGATFMQATKRFFKKYARFSGYASPSEYWWSFLAYGLIMLVASIPFIIGYIMLIASLATMDPYATSAPTGMGAAGVVVTIGGILMLIVSLAVIVPSLSVQARRLHDAGYPATLLFIHLANLITGGLGSLVLLIFMFLPTKVEARKPEWDDVKGD